MSHGISSFHHLRQGQATQRLTAVQRTALENFGLQEGMIQRATDLYFWWTSNLVASEKRLNKWKLSEKKIRKREPCLQLNLKELTEISSGRLTSSGYGPIYEV